MGGLRLPIAFSHNRRAVMKVGWVVLGLALAGWDSLALAQGRVEASVWDLTIGHHARELPVDEFIDFACGTNGGPPAIALSGWSEYAKCRPDGPTGWHEVYFQYDDEAEYMALARHDQVRARLFQYTSIYDRPVIAAALFDADGFMRGLRLVTDPRVDLMTREAGYTLGTFLQARFDGDWACENLPRLDRELAYQGTYIKRRCTLVDEVEGVQRMVETHLYRRPGQTIFDPNNMPTEGYFESTTRYEEFMIGDIPNRVERLAEVATLPDAPVDPNVARAMDCPGCELAGLNFKRANLRGANLAGANLNGANFHGADLSGADLSGADVSASNLNRAILTLTNLSGASLEGSMLHAARLDGANLAGARLSRVLASNARMIRVNLTDAFLDDADLTAIRLTSASAERADFSTSRLWQAQLSQTDFTGGRFVESDLANAVMAGIKAGGADLTGANLSHVDLRGAMLEGADLSGATMTGAIVAGASVAGANFDGTTLPAGFTPPR